MMTSALTSSTIYSMMTSNLKHLWFNIKNQNPLVWISLTAILLFSSCTPAPAAAQGISAGVHIGSYHTTGDYNNVNPGFYLKYEVSPESSYVGGIYRNSFKRENINRDPDRKAYTTYAAYLYEMSLSDSLQLGAAVGLAHGYDYPVIPLVAATASYKITSNTKVRLLVLPNAGGNNNRIDGAVFHLTLERKF